MKYIFFNVISVIISRSCKTLKMRTYSTNPITRKSFFTSRYKYNNLTRMKQFLAKLPISVRCIILEAHTRNSLFLLIVVRFLQFFTLNSYWFTLSSFKMTFLLLLKSGAIVPLLTLVVYVCIYCFVKSSTLVPKLTNNKSTSQI